MKNTILATALACTAICASFSVAAAQAPASGCAPSGGLSFVCGVQNAEDLVVVPNSRWMVASGMAPGSGLHIVDTQAKTVRNLYAVWHRERARRQDEIRELPQPARRETGGAARPEPALREQRPLHRLRDEPWRPRVGGGLRARCERRCTHGHLGRLCRDAGQHGAQQRRRIHRRLARRDRAHSSRQDIRGCVRAAEHRRRARMEAGRQDIPGASRHRAVRQQRHRDLARRSRVLRRLDDDEAHHRVPAQRDRTNRFARRSSRSSGRTTFAGLPTIA